MAVVELGDDVGQVEHALLVLRQGGEMLDLIITFPAAIAVALAVLTRSTAVVTG